MPKTRVSNPQQTMSSNPPLTKGSTVEIRSDEPGFQGAWYVATFLGEVDVSPTKNGSSKTRNVKKAKTGYLVKYETLLKDEGLCEPLTEVVDPSFVRPSPPSNVKRNGGDCVKVAEVAEEEEEGGFEVGDVVDADHRDGWWVGVVGRVIGEGELRKYVVGFADPPEEFDFERSKLRFHVDWIDGRWLIPPKKKVIWMIPPEKKTPEQESGGRNATDDASSSLTTPSKGAQIIDVDKETLSLSRSAKKNSRFSSRLKKLQSLAGSKANSKVTVSVWERSESVDIHQDSSPVEHEMIITQTRESENGTSHQKRKRGRQPKLVVKKPYGLRQDGRGVTTDIDEQPLSVWFQGMHPLSLLKKRSCYSPLDHHGNSPTQAIVTNTATTTTTPITTDYQQDWPFTKRSLIWATIESLELYQTPPQKPHFSPLKKMREDCREGLAIGHMVTFGNLVQRLSDLQPNDSPDIIKNSLETLSDLETHGFDVGPIRGRLNELLTLKSKVCQHEDTRKEVEKELEICNHEKSRVEKEIDELKAKMQEAVAMQKVKEKEVKRLQSNLHHVSNQINDLQLAFGKLAAAPL